MTDYEDAIEELNRRLQALEQPPPTVEPTPWFWKNPLANKQQLAATTSTRSAIVQEFATSNTDFTTTDTASIHEVVGVNIRVPYGPVCLFAFTAFVAKHSIASAELNYYVTVDDGLGPVTMLSFPSVFLPTADRPVNLAASGSISDANMKSVPLLRNRDIRLSLYVQNLTTGTLTIWGIASGAIPSITGFVTGDSSL